MALSYFFVKVFQKSVDTIGVLMYNKYRDRERDKNGR